MRERIKEVYFNENTPIVLFVYNRLEETRKTIESLKNNIGCEKHDLYIFSDAAKSEIEECSVKKVRNYVREINGFKSVKVIERECNFGLAKNIITGVDEVIKKYERVIVLEDDLVTSSNFLSFMQKSLDFYECNHEIWSISGFSFPIKYQDNYLYDVAFGIRASSWGWATWRDRWEKVDWDVPDYSEFIADKNARKRFNRGGSDMSNLLSRCMKGEINSWAIRFCYAQFKNNTYDVFPVVSKVKSLGFSETASNTSGMGDRFDTVLDNTDNVDFIFSNDTKINNSILKQFVRAFSIKTRLYYKLKMVLK